MGRVGRRRELRARLRVRGVTSCFEGRLDDRDLALLWSGHANSFCSRHVAVGTKSNCQLMVGRASNWTMRWSAGSRGGWAVRRRRTCNPQRSLCTETSRWCSLHGLCKALLRETAQCAQKLNTAPAHAQSGRADCGPRSLLVSPVSPTPGRLTPSHPISHDLTPRSHRLQTTPRPRAATHALSRHLTSEIEVMIEVGLSSRPRLSRLKGQALLKLGQKFDCLRDAELGGRVQELASAT